MEDSFVFKAVTFIAFAVGVVWYLSNNTTTLLTNINSTHSNTEEVSTNNLKFNYPTSLNTSYIKATDWPPQVQIVDEVYSCTKAGEETARAGQTEERTISGQNFCVTVKAEGAAGSIYRQYAYGFAYNEQTIYLSFTLRFPQCENYDEPDRQACKSEQNTFSIDSVIGDIVSAALNQTKDSTSNKIFTFSCPNNEVLSITYSGENNDMATMSYANKQYQLKRAISGSGARYANNDESVVFWEHAGKARVDIDTKTVVSECALTNS